MPPSGVMRITPGRWKINSTESVGLGYVPGREFRPAEQQERPWPFGTKGNLAVTTSSSILTRYPATYFEAWNQQDIDFAITVVAESLTWKDPLLPAPLTSRAEARTFFEFGWAAFPDLKFEGLGSPLIDEANRTVVQEWIMRGSDSGSGLAPGQSPSGRSFEVPGADVWILDADGVAKSVVAYWDSALLMRQVAAATSGDEIGGTDK